MPTTVMHGEADDAALERLIERDMAGDAMSAENKVRARGMVSYLTVTGKDFWSSGTGMHAEGNLFQGMVDTAIISCYSVNMQGWSLGPQACNIHIPR